jgi:hypothetical protein
MARPTTGVFFNSTSPAPPTGQMNIVFQTDGAQPSQSITAYMPLAIPDVPGTAGTAGALKPDGITTFMDPDGTLHALGSGGPGGGPRQRDVLSPLIDGSLQDFPLTFAPAAGSEDVVLNGAILNPDGSMYTITGSTLHMASPPVVSPSPDFLWVTYTH